MTFNKIAKQINPKINIEAPEIINVKYISIDKNIVNKQIIDKPIK